jgi:hypothetical protein
VVRNWHKVEILLISLLIPNNRKYHAFLNTL